MVLLKYGAQYKYPGKVVKFCNRRAETCKNSKKYESLSDNTKDIPLEERHEILKLRRRYYNNSLDKWIPPNQEPLFHNKNHKSPDTVSQLMIDYIEATRNLFKIQQKQIDELRSVVAELKGTEPK